MGFMCVRRVDLVAHPELRYIIGLQLSESHTADWPRGTSHPAGSYPCNTAVKEMNAMKYDGDTVKTWAGTSQWRAWRADLARFKKCGYSGWGSEGFWALTLYRLQRGLRESKPGPLLAPLRFALALDKKLFTMLTHIDLDPGAEIGPGCLIPHVGSIRVGHGAKIGADCAIYHVCTIGRTGAKPGIAQIGDHVLIGCHTSILGPVRIGDCAIVAAQTMVVNDVPEGVTVIGVPARVLPVRPRVPPSKAAHDRPGFDAAEAVDNGPRAAPTSGMPASAGHP